MRSAGASSSAPLDISDDVAMDEAEADEQPEKAKGKAKPARRLSIDAEELSVPALQSKLRAALGNNAKLPRKKPELLALYKKTCQG